MSHPSLNSPPVAPSFKGQLSNQGAVTLPGLFSPDAVAAMRQWLGTWLEKGRGVPASFEPEFEPGSEAVRKLRRLFWNDRTFWTGLFDAAGLPGIARELVGAPPALTFHAAFLKPSEVGTPVALHQDQALWRYDYPNAVSIWVALTPAGRHNGCLVGCPGSHARGAVRHVELPDHPWHPGVLWEAEGLAEPVPYELEPGDALVWDRYFVHGSGPNRSAQPRWGMVMVFVDRSQPDLRTTDRADF